ncbi:MAG: rod shape-determining protein RodA [Gammaproteobacteria bacterium]
MDRPESIAFRLHLDVTLLGAVTVTCLLGLVVLFSAADQSTDVVIKQSARMLVGLTAMIAVAQLPPRTLARWSWLAYLVGLVLLVLVLFFGSGRGADRWLDLGLVRFQPSELMKLAVPITVAALLSEKVLPPSFSTNALVLTIIGIPAALIVRQPDLGTALLVGASGIFVLFLAGISWRWIRNGFLLIVGMMPFVWYSMHDYQRQRVMTLFDPEQDPLGSGYHIIQSIIAVGSGGVSGKGWLNGTQSHLEFLPERATDFIFAVYCEEFGFFGVLVLLIAYGLILARGMMIALDAQETFGRLLAGALTLTLFIYIFVNMGMVTGQLPVVGVPLPLVSYGGTSLVTILIGFGILMSIQTHRKFLG